MKLTKTRLIGFLVLLAGAFLAGCTTRGAKESSIPWTQPADWEGQIPGMSQTGH